MHALVSQVLRTPPGWALAVAGALIFCEDALFVGFVVPGETAAILSGVLAARGSVNLAAAVAGDSVGYEVGRRAGHRLLDGRWLRHHRPRLDQAQALLVRPGGAAVFLGRFTAFFWAVMPASRGPPGCPIGVSSDGTPPADSCGGSRMSCWGTSPVTPTPPSPPRSAAAPWRSSEWSSSPLSAAGGFIDVGEPDRGGRLPTSGRSPGHHRPGNYRTRHSSETLARSSGCSTDGHGASDGDRHRPPAGETKARRRRRGDR